MKNQDFASAVVAIEHGLLLSPRMWEFYQERARCNLSLRNLHRVVEDSSKALEILYPEVQANAAERAECHFLRALALKELGLMKEAMIEAHEAVKLGGGKKKLYEEMENVIRDELQDVE